MVVISITNTIFNRIVLNRIIPFEGLCRLQYFPSTLRVCRNVKNKKTKIGRVTSNNRSKVNGNGRTLFVHFLCIHILFLFLNSLLCTLFLLYHFIYQTGYKKYRKEHVEALKMQHVWRRCQKTIDSDD